MIYSSVQKKIYGFSQSGRLCPCIVFGGGGGVGGGGGGGQPLVSAVHTSKF